ncbi:hypothetical protein AUR64_10080 [Haloprofundus marisrubri]|uniref:TM2 domain-containing protein n=1 Tax=Haloprofundus marisrubri TaxID=1514971 RepID=A0A0W1RA55_9EURY|nr:TM2 domain-containing protein [Haloprofundus marisrubri]KTG09954.1 hypothetical protein AUR64_10080 [Haloprofundus marisrubri]
MSSREHDSTVADETADGSGASDASSTSDDSTQRTARNEQSTETAYCRECGDEIVRTASFCPQCGAKQPGGEGRHRVGPESTATEYADSLGEDRRLVAGLLAILLGTIGAHKFYLGRTGFGILYLLFFWTGIPTIVGIIEGAIYLSKSPEQFHAQYFD